MPKRLSLERFSILNTLIESCLQSEQMNAAKKKPDLARRRFEVGFGGVRQRKRADLDFAPMCETAVEPPKPGCNSARKRKIEQELAFQDESFSEMLLRYIDASGMTDAECYKKARIDRKLFSKIRSDVHYRPSKQTVVAFCFALELSEDASREMLEKAGFSLSRSNKFDIIVMYFLQNEIYSLDELNDALYEFDQVLVGA